MDFLEALSDPTVTPAQIIKALRTKGITLNGSIITRYRVLYDVR